MRGCALKFFSFLERGVRGKEERKGQQKGERAPKKEDAGFFFHAAPPSLLLIFLPSLTTYSIGLDG